MRWRGREQSENIEDRRGAGPVAIGGGLALVVAAVAAFTGLDRGTVSKFVSGVQSKQAVSAGKDDEARQFLAVVLRDTETVWTRLFREHGHGTYKQPKLVIFSGEVQSACGKQTSAVGPFYCPGDQQIYIDPSFWDELAKRHQAPGDFAHAYVVAHEVGHHVQNLLGYSKRARAMKRKARSQAQKNRATVRLELQADFLAGVWAHHAQKDFKVLEPGDIQEAINAANQIGDDTLQLKARGLIVPERFTHGTSQQRMRWFKAGLDSGQLKRCQDLFTLRYDEL